MPSNPVINKLKELNEDKIKTLSSGVRVIIPGTSQFELQEMALESEPVKPPRFTDPETGREVENYNDPDYIDRLNTMQLKRGLRLLDSMLIGVVLADGLPDDSDYNNWVATLKFKEKMGYIHLNGLDIDNPGIEKEYAFKKYVAFIDTDDLDILKGKVKKAEEAAKKADEIFPGDEARDADSGSASEEGSEGQPARNNV